jgi:hypothetical protein
MMIIYFNKLIIKKYKSKHYMGNSFRKSNALGKNMPLAKKQLYSQTISKTLHELWFV